MMQLLHPTYTIKIEVKDGALPPPAQVAGQMIQAAQAGTYPAKKWHGVDGGTGCDKLVAEIRKALAAAGISDAVVTLDRFEHRA